MDPRKMAQAMKKMGIQQVELDATEVIIKLKDKELVIPQPKVSKVKMMGQETYQIQGEAFEREKTVETEVKKEDIQAIVEQTGVSEEQAEAALKEKGDLAEAILSLQE